MSEVMPNQSEQREFPRKGDVMRVLDNDEIRGSGGLVIHNILENGGKTSSGTNHLEDIVVRMPPGTTVTAEQFFTDEKGLWVVFDYTYHNLNRGDTYPIKGCALVQKLGAFDKTSYMEKVPLRSAADELKKLREEISGGTA